MSNRITREPSLRALSFALRNKALWPDNFVWGFVSCSTCGMGMASCFWNDEIPEPTVGHLARAFGMKIDDVIEIFCRGTREYLMPSNDDRGITPEVIADRIDQYLQPIQAALI